MIKKQLMIKKYYKNILKYGIKLYTNFQHKKIQKDNEYCACLFVTLLDSIFDNLDKEYYRQVLLEECKYTIKNKKIVKTINEDLELSESDESDNESDK